MKEPNIFLIYPIFCLIQDGCKCDMPHHDPSVYLVLMGGSLFAARKQAYEVFEEICQLPDASASARASYGNGSLQKERAPKESQIY